MNICNQLFLKENNIDIDEITRELDCKIYNFGQINPILFENEFQEKEIQKEVCIGDVLGNYSNQNSGNIFQTMDECFDENGDGYHTRALGMLELNTENAIEKLRYSFQYEPIGCAHVENGKYVIMTNGLHRFMVLKILYLKEIQDAKGNKEKINQIREKYTVPMRVININSNKAYCKYLLEKTNPLWIDRCEIVDEKQDMDENGNIIENRYIVKVKKGSGRNCKDDIYTLTEKEKNEVENMIYSVSNDYKSSDENVLNVKVTYANGDQKKLTEQELIEFTKDRVKNTKNKEYLEYSLKKDLYNCKGLKSFLNEHFSEIFNLKQFEQYER
ncbi:MAG: hypothetical protein J6N78_01210 [Clostridia bacterium]|nr:hypothetical protein [Clostridia bacterium]